MLMFEGQSSAELNGEEKLACPEAGRQESLSALGRGKLSFRVCTWTQWLRLSQARGTPFRLLQGQSFISIQTGNQSLCTLLFPPFLSYEKQ